jgi:hypothetical protein
VAERVAAVEEHGSRRVGATRTTSIEGGPI